ncbi:DivIVA domain-containing protein [Micromonospora sp. NBS 11-29]|uniref:DivIVA domain-containing protein n=1 Tax=Micromonospora sp. NBS 11-29 TaxID=1960879 RepID=UPI0020CF2D96|nr:DivIVA domain-containing protein [Micromonospora sp. NBS 11-29]
MRNPFRRQARRPDEPPPPYRSPLHPSQVRERCFTVRRRGLDPAEIRAFLHRVADELAVAQATVVALRQENVRVTNALRAQSAQHRYR